MSSVPSLPSALNVFVDRWLVMRARSGFVTRRELGCARNVAIAAVLRQVRDWA